jgi:hypothetical protein
MWVVSSIITYMKNSESERSEIEAFLREAMEADIVQNGILTKALVISEWITPDGKRYLARSPIGEITQWDIQGFCISTMESGGDWENTQDDED